MLIDNLVTRFPNGVNNQDVGSIFNAIPFPSRDGYYVFDEEFWTWTAAQWTETDVAGANTVAPVAGAGGLVVMTTGGTDNNEVQIQRVAAGISVANVLLDPTKKFFMECIFTAGDLDLSEFLIGLAITDTTLLAGMTDGLTFRKAEGSAVLTAIAEKDSVEASVDAGTLVAGANVARMYYDGGGAVLGRLYASVGDAIGGYVVAGPSISDDEELEPSAAIRTGEGAAKTLTIDRIFFAQER
jgi:hypothetical protein